MPRKHSSSGPGPEATAPLLDRAPLTTCARCSSPRPPPRPPPALTARARGGAPSSARPRRCSTAASAPSQSRSSARACSRAPAPAAARGYSPAQREERANQTSESARVHEAMSNTRTVSIHTSKFSLRSLVPPPSSPRLHDEGAVENHGDEVRAERVEPLPRHEVVRVRVNVNLKVLLPLDLPLKCIGKGPRRGNDRVRRSSGRQLNEAEGPVIGSRHMKQRGRDNASAT